MQGSSRCLLLLCLLTSLANFCSVRSLESFPRCFGITLMATCTVATSPTPGLSSSDVAVLRSRCNCLLPGCHTGCLRQSESASGNAFVYKQNNLLCVWWSKLSACERYIPACHCAGQCPSTRCQSSLDQSTCPARQQHVQSSTVFSSNPYMSPDRLDNSSTVCRQLTTPCCCPRRTLT